MKLSTNIVVQVLGLLVQGLNQFEEIFPAEAKIYITFIVGLAQLIIGILAHFSNIDGTPQEIAFVDKK